MRNDDLPPRRAGVVKNTAVPTKAPRRGSAAGHQVRTTSTASEQAPDDMSVQDVPPGRDSRQGQARHRILGSSRRSPHKPASRRTNIRHANTVSREILGGPAHRRPLGRRRSDWTSQGPIRLPIVANELDAIERLLGRELRLLFQRP